MLSSSMASLSGVSGFSGPVLSTSAFMVSVPVDPLMLW